MTYPLYRSLAKQFKAAIEIALDVERAASSGQVPPDFGRADGTGRGSLSAQATRKL